MMALFSFGMTEVILIVIIILLVLVFLRTRRS